MVAVTALFIAVVTSFPVPVNRFCLIFGGAPTISVHHSKTILRLSKILLRRFTEPLKGFAIISSDAATFSIQQSKIILCFRIALNSSASIPLKRFSSILCNPISQLVVEGLRQGGRQPDRITMLQGTAPRRVTSRHISSHGWALMSRAV